MEPTPEDLRDLRLQDLILKRKRELRLSWDELAERSTASGYTISVNRWHYWAQTEWINTSGRGAMPNPDVIRSIAAAIELPTDTVYEAAGVSAQLYTRTVQVDPKMRIMVAAFNDVPPADHDMVIDMVRTIARARRAAETGDAQDTDDAGKNA